MNSQPEETPIEVPEADALEQRLPATPEAGTDELYPLPEDAPEADVLEQRTPLVSQSLADVPAPGLSDEDAAEADAIEQAEGMPGGDEEDYPFGAEQPEE